MKKKSGWKRMLTVAVRYLDQVKNYECSKQNLISDLIDLIQNDIGAVNQDFGLFQSIDRENGDQDRGWLELHEQVGSCLTEGSQIEYKQRPLVARPFALERFFGKYEQSSKYLLCVSDCESWTTREICAFEPDGVEGLLNTTLSYGQNEGSPKLRDLISKTYSSNPHVLLHVGAQEAIYNFFNSIITPKDHVIVVNPCYQSLYECPIVRGCQTSKWNLIKSNERFCYDLDILPSLLKANTRCIVINSPHNPTGACLSETELQSIVEICRERKIILFADEVYSDIFYLNDFKQPQAVCEMYELAISLGVLSKSCGLAGVRLGWIATQSKEFFHMMADLKDYTTISCPIPCEYLAMIAIKNKEKLIERNLEIVKKNISIFKEFCEKKFPNVFGWEEPFGGCLSFVRFNSEKMTTAQLVTECLERKSLLLLPSNLFDPQNVNHFRIGFGRKNFEECLKQFEIVLQELEGKY